MFIEWFKFSSALKTALKNPGSPFMDEVQFLIAETCGRAKIGQK